MQLRTSVLVKGAPNRKHKLAGKRRKSKNVFICRLYFAGFCQKVIQKKYLFFFFFFFLLLELEAQPCWFALLPTKNRERKRLAGDVIATFATRFGLVHDVTDTDC